MSWAIVSLVSNRFEPFDSGLGFFIGQFILSVVAFEIGRRYGAQYIIVFIFSAYMGMNAYAYLFGGSEQRAWFLLGLFTMLSLIIIPTILGFLGREMGAKD